MDHFNVIEYKGLLLKNWTLFYKISQKNKKQQQMLQQVSWANGWWKKVYINDPSNTRQDHRETDI